MLCHATMLVTKISDKNKKDYNNYKDDNDDYNGDDNDSDNYIYDDDYMTIMIMIMTVTMT